MSSLHEKNIIKSMQKEKDPVMLWIYSLIKFVVFMVIVLGLITGYSKLSTFTVYNHQPTNIYEPVEVSGYSSEVGQTDDSPFIMASNKRVYDGAIANNCKDFGEKVMLMGKEYTVEDRMNRRYGCEHYDIWFESTEEALAFGRQQLIVQIIR